ncbi:MAG: hypothetical protein GY768_23475 [Planctomycetaceae bacterium]|nr:hypothetical protein [Planctomycetaceae bacterium]
MGLAILGVLVLAFIALTVFSAKTWQIWHVVLMFALFIATFCFMAFAAATLKTQERWRTQYVRSTTDLKKAEDEQLLLTKGFLLTEDSISEADDPSLPQIQSDLRRLLVDRGRVWRNLAVASIGQGSITLDASNWGDEACYQQRAGGDEYDDFDDEPVEPIPAEGEAAAAGTSKPLGLQQNSIVFAFKEAPIAQLPSPLQQLLYGDNPLAENDKQGFCKVPAFYLGEFKVTNDPQADPNTVKLEPNLPLDKSQIEQLQEGSSWVLYEVLPIDSHEATQDLTSEELQLWLPPMTEDQDRYLAVIDQYVRDQKQANDMDPPERKWMKVRFTESKSDIDVDVSEPTSMPDAPFDPSGRANADDLRQFKTVGFEKGDEVVVDFLTGQEFINQGIAELVEPIYVRQLRDYERFFRANLNQMDATRREIDVTDSDLAKLNEALADLRSQIQFSTNQRQLLTADRDGFKMEVAIIQQYQQALEQQWKALLSDLSRLYRANKQQVRQQFSEKPNSTQPRSL